MKEGVFFDSSRRPSVSKRVSFDAGIVVESDSDEAVLIKSQPSTTSEEFKERFEEFRR